MAKEYSYAEVKKHNNNQGAWVVIHNEVFDVSTFLNEHPGGEEVLLEQAGKDASEAFEDVGHSTDARELMQKYKIGDIVECERKPVREKVTTWTSDNDGKGSNQTNFKSWILPIALGILASVIYRFYIQSQ
ncbi:cytb5 [Trypoxylus dichotomus]